MRRCLLLTLFVVALGCPAMAQQSNFADRRSFIVNNCPHVELSDFSFENRYADRATRFYQNLSWKNVGAQPLVAFEVVVLKYDPFNRRLVGSRWTVTGKNSADWSTLGPGESSADGTISYGDEEVFTAIAYVRAARLADGTIWQANDVQLLAKLRTLGAGIADFGDTKPDPKPPTVR
jgi:hypothetical protein